MLRNRKFSIIVMLSALFVGAYSYRHQDDPSKTIRMASIIFRHGERNPIGSFPTDPNLNYPWPGGLNALVPKGALNLLNHGKKLHERYSKLIPKDGYYDQNAMRVTSSQYERCLMSAESFLAGFMPPQQSSNILPLKWQPIPIITVPPTMDYVIFPLAYCPVYDNVYESFASPSHEYYNQTYAPYRNVFELLNTMTEQPFSLLMDIEGLYSTFEIQEATGLHIADWAHEIFPEPMKEIVKLNSRLFTYTDWMKKMKGGPMLTEILDNMNDKRNQRLNPDRSIFIYSGHDVTLKNLINTMGFMSPEVGEMPDFGATLVIELHENKSFRNRDMEVRIVYYNNGYVKVPINVKIPNCKMPCSLSKFTALMQAYVIRNVEEICHDQSHKFEL